MKCKLCGGETQELGANRYRCKYCSHEFEDAIVYADNFSAPTNFNTGFDAPRDFITGGLPLGSQDYVNSDASVNLAASEAQGEVMSGDQIYDNAIDGVVEIYASDKDGTGASSSGFVVSECGFVLTNAHAVLNENDQIYENITIKTVHGEYRGFVIAAGRPADGVHDSIDLCLLYVHGLHVKPNPLGDVSKIRNGQKVYLIGNSLGSGTCITSGIISDKERAIEGLSYPYIMTDAAANPGNSGGPLYNEHGEIIGVLVAGIDGAKGMNYAIPADIVKLFLSFVVENTALKNKTDLDISKYALSKNAYAHAFDISTALSGLKLFLEIAMFVLGLF